MSRSRPATVCPTDLIKTSKQNLKIRMSKTVQKYFGPKMFCQKKFWSIRYLGLVKIVFCLKKSRPPQN